MESDGSTQKVMSPPDVTYLPALRPTKASGTRSKTWLSIIALAIGLGFTIVAAYVGPDASTTVAIALTCAAGIFQISSVVIANSNGRPDTNLVRNKVRSLQNAQKLSQESTQLVESLFDTVNRKEEKGAIGKVSRDLSVIENELASSIETWRDIRPDLFVNQDGKEKNK